MSLSFSVANSPDYFHIKSFLAVAAISRQRLPRTLQISGIANFIAVFSLQIQGVESLSTYQQCMLAMHASFEEIKSLHLVLNKILPPSNHSADDLCIL